MLFEAGQKGISDFLGAASITCWLFAQFPQVIENYRLGSCKGLALPFLINWLLGDFTNLIGCIFTDQLPFQTYLATYFTFVDAILILQFWYYGRKHSHRLRHAHHHPHHSSQTSRQGSQYLYQSTSRPRLSQSRTRSARSGMFHSRPGSLATSVVGADGSQTPDHKVPSLSPHPIGESQTLVRFQETHDAFPPEPFSQYDRRSRSRSQSNSDSEEIPPEMTESILSKRSDASSSTIGALARGRSIYRPTTSASAPDIRVAGLEDVNETNWRQLSGSRTRGATGPRDRPSQSRTRSVVFLSIWAFIGIGQLYKRGSFPLPSKALNHSKGMAWKALISRNEHATSSVASVAAVTALDDGLSPHPIDYSLLVGRVAAWLCVCFYLTSRMPQIWKNFKRRSVEGLSILLFAAAFMGNLFYVLSILSSPLVKEDDTYLFESVPFLLGSGGTLIFDLTIMGQACMYAGLSPKHHEKSEYLNSEEESGLLARDSQNDLSEGWEGGNAWEGHPGAARA